MPGEREPHWVLDESPNELGLLFWRVIMDLHVWRWSSGMALFASDDLTLWRILYPWEISAPLRELEMVVLAPESARADEVAQACESLWMWAETRNLTEAALQFAEIVAFLEPENPERACTCGRICRRREEYQRGTRWFSRASRLARRQNDDRSFSIARMGWAHLEEDLGNLSTAEKHATKALRAASRTGRVLDAGYTSHTLATILVNQDRLEAAWMHIRNPVASYPADHPRIPALAHDVAFLWGKMGYFSSALPIYTAVLPTLTSQAERAIVLANIARAASASGDLATFEKAKRELLRALEEGGEVPIWALYHLACATVNARDWSLAERLSAMMEVRAPQRYGPNAAELSERIRARGAGDENHVPESDPHVDEIRAVVLSKLQVHIGPGAPRAVCPEQYPMLHPPRKPKESGPHP